MVQQPADCLQAASRRGSKTEAVGQVQVTQASVDDNDLQCVYVTSQHAGCYDKSSLL